MYSAVFLVSLTLSFLNGSADNTVNRLRNRPQFTAIDAGNEVALRSHGSVSDRSIPSSLYSTQMQVSLPQLDLVLVLIECRARGINLFPG